MLRDFGHAIRRLGHTKGWTAVVLMSLALGIGANTALFTAVNGVLLQSVALPEPDALVRLKWSGKNDMMRNSSDYGSSQTYQGQNVRSTVSHAVFLAMRAANQTLTDLAAGAPFGAFNVIVDGAADLASGFQASGNYFAVLRVPLLLGRGLSEADDQPGASPVAVISHAFWQKRFAGDPAVVGRTVPMNGLPVTIVGVTRPEFTGIQRLAATAPDVTVPIALEARLSPNSKQAQEPTTWYLQTMGRLKPGITLAQVQGNL